MTKRKIIIISIILVIIICFFNSIFNSNLKNKSGKGLNIKVEKVNNNYLYSDVTIDGVIDSPNILAVNFNYNIIVKNIYVKENEMVKDGQKIFLFDYTNLDNQIFNAEKEIKSIVVSISQAEMEIKQYEEKRDNNQTSEEEKSYLNTLIEKKNNQINLYKDQINSTNKQINSLKDQKSQIEYYEISHQSGIITKLNANLGICTGISYIIKNINDYIVTSEVEQKYYDVLNVNQNININTNIISSNKLLKGSIIEKDNMILKDDNGNYKFKIKIKINEDCLENNNIALGMKVTCSIPIKSNEELPTCSYDKILKDVDGKTYVFIYDEKNKKINKRYIKISNSDNSNIQISEGVENGELLVISPKDSYKDGDSVSYAEVGE